jgi:hypothetical protein
MPKTTKQVLAEQARQADAERVRSQHSDLSHPQQPNRSTIMTAAESYDEWFPSNFWKADDLDDGPMPILTITDIHPEKMQDGNSKPCVFFKEDKRALVLNVTNKNSLIALSRSKNPADAIGLRVMLVQVEAEYQGKPCKALRIRKPPTLGGAGAGAPPRQPKPGAARQGRPAGKKTLAEDMNDEIPDTL